MKTLVLGAVVAGCFGSLAASSADAHWFMSCRRFYGPAHGGFAYPNARFTHVDGSCCCTWCGGCGYYCWANGEGCGTGCCGCYGGMTELPGTFEKPLPPLPPSPRPMLPRPEMPTTPAPPAPDRSAQHAAPQDGVIMAVFVPSDARVFINGAPTSLTGYERLFRSQGLESGRSYGYELRAELDRGGKKLVETRLITAKAGETVPVAFSFTQTETAAVISEEVPLRTTLRLHVPADAQVFLNGNPTRSTGPLRTFATSNIAPGESSAVYDVRVEVQRNGRKVVEEKTISIETGRTHDLTMQGQESSPTRDRDELAQQ